MKTIAAMAALLLLATLTGPVVAQPSAAQSGAAAGASGSGLPLYRPPLRGAPGGRVGGASRGGPQAVALPRIDLLAPDDHSGLTMSPAPDLLYFISGPTPLPVKLTISAPQQAMPLLETAIAMPRQAGVQRIRLSDYRVQLTPGVNYSWSVSVVVDPQSPSDDLVATATIMRVAPDPAIANAAMSAPPPARAALFAQAGLWYDAAAAAAAAATYDRHAALDALMQQVGLVDQAAYDRQVAAAGE